MTEREYGRLGGYLTAVSMVGVGYVTWWLLGEWQRPMPAWIIAGSTLVLVALEAGERRWGNAIRWGAAAVGVVIILLAVALPAKAEPEDGWRIIKRKFELCDWAGCRHVWRDVRVRHYEPRVYGYSRREDEWERRDPSTERGVHCKDEVVRVVGGLHISKDGAINDAVRQWQSTVRYDHGERYMDIESARGYVWRCDRAGTNETLAGRVGEAITGGSGYQRRCVVMARPCRMPMARGDEDKR